MKSTRTKFMPVRSSCWIRRRGHSGPAVAMPRPAASVRLSVSMPRSASSLRKRSGR